MNQTQKWQWETVQEHDERISRCGSGETYAEVHAQSDGHWNVIIYVDGMFQHSGKDFGHKTAARAREYATARLEKLGATPPETPHE